MDDAKQKAPREKGASDEHEPRRDGACDGACDAVSDDASERDGREPQRDEVSEANAEEGLAGGKSDVAGTSAAVAVRAKRSPRPTFDPNPRGSEIEGRRELAREASLPAREERRRKKAVSWHATP